MDFRRFAGIMAISSLMIVMGGVAGCTKKPNQQDISKLEESKSAAESAERKLAELRQERMKLEQDLQNKQAQLQGEEGERDNLKKSAGK